MSRCFPFPPPGYELKARPDDVNLITKDKEKHKKHKDKKDKDKKERGERKEKEGNEKKEKDKKERGERKEKEGSEDTHKEDKKRKRKEHKDKKDTNKDKPSSSGEKKGEEISVGFLENIKGQKLEIPDIRPANAIQDKGTVIELGSRVNNNGEATGNHMVHNIAIVERGKASFLGKAGKEHENCNVMYPIKDKRDPIRNSYGANQIKVEGTFCQVEKVEKTKEEKVDETKEEKGRNGYKNIVGEVDGSKNGDQIKNTKAEDKKRKEEKKEDKKRKKEEKKEDKKRKKEKKKEFSKEKLKQETNDGNFLDDLKENDECRGKLPKLKQLNDFLDDKDSGVRLDNSSRPAIVSHQASQTGGGFCPPQNTINLGVGKRAVIIDQKVNGKLSSPQSVIDNVNVGPYQTANNTKTDGRVSVHNHVVSNGIISPHIVRFERKMEPPCQSSNGVAMVKHIVNRSANGKIPSSPPFVENEGKTGMQAPDTFHKMIHNKESRKNGSLEAKKSSSSIPLSPPLKRKEKVAATSKPHPDLKYLSQILAVPEVEWPQCYDQEWLFDHKDSQKKRPKLASSENQLMKQVWSEAVELEYADVTALPYVIPY